MNNCIVGITVGVILPIPSNEPAALTSFYSLLKSSAKIITQLKDFFSRDFGSQDFESQSQLCQRAYSLCNISSGFLETQTDTASRTKPSSFDSLKVYQFDSRCQQMCMSTVPVITSSAHHFSFSIAFLVLASKSYMEL